MSLLLLLQSQIFPRRCMDSKATELLQACCILVIARQETFPYVVTSVTYRARCGTRIEWESNLNRTRIESESVLRCVKMQLYLDPALFDNSSIRRETQYQRHEEWCSTSSQVISGKESKRLLSAYNRLLSTPKTNSIHFPLTNSQSNNTPFNQATRPDNNATRSHPTSHLNITFQTPHLSHQYFIQSHPNPLPLNQTL